MADDCEDLESLTKQLSSLVTSLQQQGILDKYFDIFYKVKEDTGNPLFFLRTALAFCSNAERLLNSLHRALHFPVVDFNDILEYNIKLKGSSSSIGLRGMVLGCADLAKAINRESREG
ncbi:hypothetical protein CDL15_Pgr026144 [Punica granatum]|uniref:Histidine-containing phosphotransfer protein n=1 Tax=Punica granatum TaxID=22663 RepID=A0A218WBP0_PUNGR|nr:hypothetical protein CDL15_Pgr026144 [Punica granatum]